MKRLLIALTLLTMALAASCGGGGGTTPDQADTNSPTADQIAELQAAFEPLSVTGDHSVSLLPGRLNLLTSADDARLNSLAQRYGFEVLNHNEAKATIGFDEGADLAAFASRLEKEPVILRAEPVHVINTPATVFSRIATVRSSSFTPLDPFYANVFDAFPFVDTESNVNYGQRLGPALPMSVMGFNAAWDVSLNPDVSDEPVSVAIIDAGWYDYSTTNRAGLDETILDAVNSGYIADNGTFTAGLDAAAWETRSVDEGGTFSFRPYRDAGEVILGIMAASINDYTPWALDIDASGTVEEDEVWNEGIAGINPFATYILIKTGVEAGGSWTFSDNHLAESIDHAVAAGANIIVLGMFGDGAVGANVSTAIQNARDNDVLVFAPAGDIISTFDAGNFTGTIQDITVDPVSPASDPNCVSVGSTGYFRAPMDLPDVDGLPNSNVGWDFEFGFLEILTDPFHEVTRWSNTGADIAAVGWGIGFGDHPFLISGGDGSEATPFNRIPGEKYNTFNISAFGSVHAVAYVAGAATQVFQTLSFVNATPPTDDEVLNELLSSVQLPNLDGTDGGGLLNAGAAMTSAINGGSLNTILPAMQFTSVEVSQPFVAVTRGTDFGVTALVQNGTAPLTFEIDWGNGDPPTTVDPWTNGDPVTLTGGYDSLGLTVVNMTVTDADNRTASFPFEIHVINPLAINIVITNVEGQVVAPAALNVGQQYRFNSNATNVYTGDIGGTPNNTSFGWWFEGLTTPLPAPDATGPNPVFAYTSAGSFDIALIVEEDVRPDTLWQISVTVN